LKFKGSGIEGAKQILNFYKFGVPVKFEKERVVKYVQLFDYGNIENNEFIITRQVSYDGRERIRTDIMLYVNGVPLVNIECKNPASLAESWFNAYRQIKDYEGIVPELYKYVQIGVACEAKAMYFPIVPWQDEVKVHEWREELKDSVDSMIEILSGDRLLEIIRDFLFFRVEFGDATKVITRYMQYRAANKIVDRVLKSLSGEDDKNKGLIWHWQGSGKTLTMIFAANKLYWMDELENPTIFFIVDRIELEEQLYKEFYALDIVEPEIIDSIRRLKEAISFDDYRGKRGVFITLIHKFRPEELEELQKEVEELSKDKETIANRKNVIAFIDEGHRSQYGLLAAQMKAILKSAFFFALTGTPISKRGKDTYLAFSYPPEEMYLDRYFITDSIRDGFTVKIAYQPRLEDLHLRRDMLEAFLEVEFEELPELIRGEVEERVKKRLNPIMLFLEAPERIKVVAEDIAHHFKENVDGRFKAMVVAPSRKACVLYKMELDRHLPTEYSEVVMTYTRGDPALIQNYLERLKERYRGKDIDEIRKEIVEEFKEGVFPKILVVTDMLLAGFDAPVLQTMYLDKPLKEHRLLQAVARTNRPYRDVKEAGVVIDYVGILNEFKRALEMYSEEDIKGALYNFENIRDEFDILIKEVRGIFKDIPMEYDRKTLLDAIEALTGDEGKEKEFIESYRRLRKIFELLGPDEIKLERFEEYRWLSSLYTYYMKALMQRPHEGYVEKYLDKTVRFVHKTTEIERLEKELPVIVFDENYLRNLEESVKSTKEKAANILFTLNRLVLVDRHKNPVYDSLVERVERLLELWREKTKDYEMIYREGVRTIEEIESLSCRQKELGFSDMEYALLLELEKKFGRSEDLVEDVRRLSETLGPYMFRGWMAQATSRKQVEREVRRFVRRYKQYGISLEELNELYGRLIEHVKSYGG
jgi:type I restriction enzyme R subunit